MALSSKASISCATQLMLKSSASSIRVPNLHRFTSRLAMHCANANLKSIRFARLKITSRGASCTTMGRCFSATRKLCRHRSACSRLESAVTEFQKNAGRAAATFGNNVIELQPAAMAALLKARAVAREEGLENLAA